METMIRSTTAATATLALLLCSTTGFTATTAPVGGRGTFAGPARHAAGPVDNTSPACRLSNSNRGGRRTRTTSRATSLRMYVGAPTKTDFYEVLGVSRGADASVIKRAYRNLAKQYHPDANIYKGRNTSEKFRAICEAYEVLSKDETRSKYDGSKSAAASSHRASTSTSPFGGFGQHVADGFDSFFRVNNPGARATGSGAGSPRRGTSSAARNGAGAGAAGRGSAGTWDFSGVGVGVGGAGRGAGAGAGAGRRAAGSSRSGAAGVGAGTSGRGASEAWKDFSGVGVGGSGASRGGSRAARWGSSGAGAGAGRGTSGAQKTARAGGAERGSAGAWDFGGVGVGVGATEKKTSGSSRYGSSSSSSSGAGREAAGAQSSAGVAGRCAGGPRSGPGIPEDGDDVQFDLEVDFKTAVFGGDEVVRVSHLETCGMGDGDQANGDGRTSRTKSIKITIPPGIESGTMLRVRGEGDVGLNGGSVGDLYISVKVKRDEERKFRKEGPDIYSNVTINYVDAVIGSSIKVPVVGGEATLDIPPGTQPGQVIRLKGNGAPLLGAKDTCGDHYVTVIVDIPTNISKEERALLNKVNDLKGGSKNEKAKPSSTGSCAFCGGTDRKKVRVAQKKKKVASPAQHLHHQTVSKLLGKDKYTVKDLKAALRERGLKLSGLKADLMERLHSAVCAPAATIPEEKPETEPKVPFLNKVSQKAIDNLLMEIRQHV